MALNRLQVTTPHRDRMRQEWRNEASSQEGPKVQPLGLAARRHFALVGSGVGGVGRHLFELWSGPGRTTLPRSVCPIDHLHARLACDRWLRVAPQSPDPSGLHALELDDFDGALG